MKPTGPIARFSDGLDSTQIFNNQRGPKSGCEKPQKKAQNKLIKQNLASHNSKKMWILELYIYLFIRTCIYVYVCKNS